MNDAFFLKSIQDAVQSNTVDVDHNTLKIGLCKWPRFLRIASTVLLSSGRFFLVAMPVKQCFKTYVL